MRHLVDKTYVDADGSTRFNQFHPGLLDYDTGVIFWQESSLFIEDETVSDLQLDDLCAAVLEDYDFAGDTPVNRQQWERIVELAAQAGGAWQEAIEELTPWAEETLRTFGNFTIIGM